MTKFYIDNERGQALTEFILFALLFASMFGLLTFMHRRTQKSIDFAIAQRNAVFDTRKEGATDRYLAYVASSTDLCRFREVYNGQGVPLKERQSKLFRAFQYESTGPDK
ncbi:MAG: hypothetical protein JNL74_00375 [Fibrobacteres bacterium]|nr:hypothetical protein [Fibrobacterota bacterium]